MRLLRYAALVALAIWIGGLLTLGAIVAPTAFVVVDAQQVEGGRALVGLLFGLMLHRFHGAAYVAGGVVLASLIGRRLIGPRPVHFGVRMVLAAAMLAVVLYSGQVLTGQVERIQAEVGVPSLTLPEGHPARGRFNSLHRLSVVLMGFNVLGGLALLGWEAAEHG